jgi:hypothetical protein
MHIAAQRHVLNMHIAALRHVLNIHIAALRYMLNMYIAALRPMLDMRAALGAEPAGVGLAEWCMDGVDAVVTENLFFNVDGTLTGANQCSAA